MVRFRRTVIRTSGYSLLELLITLMIMVVLFSFGYANYRDFDRRKVMDGLISDMGSKLKLTQEYATAGYKPNNAVCNSPRTLLSYRFVRVDASTIRVDAVCSGGSVVVVGPNAISSPGIEFTEIREYDNNCSNSTSTTVGAIDFNPVGKGVEVDQDRCLVLLFTQTQTGNTQTITVYPSGAIE